MTDKTFKNRYGSIEISAQGDIELLDYALRNSGFGHVERAKRFFNIPSLEHYVFTFTRKGKTRTWQPFRAAFARNAADNCVVQCGQQMIYPQQMIEQGGFNIVAINKGDIEERPMVGSMTFTGSYSLNGRTLKLKIETGA